MWESFSRAELANFSYEGTDNEYFRLYTNHQISVATTKFCHCSQKAAIDNTQTNDRVPIKLYLQKQMGATFGWAIIC